MTVSEPQKLRLEYEIFGIGPKLLFLHGGGTDYRFYQSFIDQLAKNYSVYTFALPGFGKSGRLKSYTAVGLTTLIDEFVREVHLANFVLVGHSLGGGLALSYAALHQNNVNKLVLLAPQIYPNRKGVLAMMNALAQNARLEGKHYDRNNRLRLGNYLKRLVRIRTSLASLAQLRYVTETDLSEFLDQIELPVLGVIGAQDLVIPPDEQRQGLAQLKNARIIEYPQNGHNALFNQSSDIISEISKLT